MTGRRGLIVAGAVLLGLAGLAWLLLGPGPAGEKLVPGVPDAEPVGDAAAAVSGPTARDPEGVPSVTVEGIVIAASGRPVEAGVEVVASREGEDSFRAVRTTAADGRFRVAVPASKERVRIGAEDASSGEAAEERLAVSPERPPRFLVLRLRATMVVLGRVVDRQGRPAPGATVRVDMTEPWRMYFVEDRADEAGRFLMRLGKAESGAVRARDADGRLGPARRFQAPASGPVDLGDVVLPGEKGAVWNLSFVDDAGQARTDVRLSSSAVGPDETGAFHLDFECDPDPAEVRVEGDELRPVRLRMPISEPGRRAATVTLLRKPSFLVRPVGAGAADLLRRGATLVVTQRSHGPAPRIVDVVSGEELPASGAFEGGGHTLSVRAEKDGWRVFFSRFDACEYELRVGGREIVGGRWPVGEEWAGRVVELLLPEGRFVTLDLHGLRRRARENEALSWTSPYGAWPVQSATGGVSFLENWDPSGDCEPTTLLATSAASVPDEVELWVPARCRAVRFGFPLDPGLSEGHRASEYGVSVPVPEGTDRIEAPAPEALAGMTVKLRLRVRVDGQPFRQAGIPLHLGGDESLFVRTDENGEAVIHAFAGRYSAGIARTVAAHSRSRSAPEIEVRPPAGEILVPLDLEWKD